MGGRIEEVVRRQNAMAVDIQYERIKTETRRRNADQLRVWVRDGKLQLAVRHFRCSCGQCDNDYLVPAENPDTSSLDIQAIIDALGLKDGDVLEISRRSERE